MALISCAECGNQISDKATACPNCGAPPDATPDAVPDDSASLPPKKRRWWPWLIAILGVSFCVSQIPEDPDRQAARDARQAEQAAAQAEAQAAKNAEDAENRRKGFHCLSSWDGSHRAFRDRIKTGLRNPDSFDLIETRVAPVDANGLHRIIMDYRAENGFGGMTIGTATGTYRQDNCEIAGIEKLE